MRRRILTPREQARHAVVSTPKKILANHTYKARVVGIYLMDDGPHMTWAIYGGRDIEAKTEEKRHD